MRNFLCISARKTLRSSAFFLLLACFAQVASAEDYYWTTSSAPGSASLKHSSTESACRQHFKDSTSISYDHFEVISGSVPLAAYCYALTSKGVVTHTPYNNTLKAYRFGDQCTPPKVYSKETGSCNAPEPDKCESTKAQQVEHEYNAGPISQAVPNMPDTTICNNSCQYSRTTTVKGCARFLDNDDGTTDLNSVYCTVMYQGTGQSCTAGNPSPGSVFDQPPSKPPVTKTPEYTKDEGCGEWTATSSGGSMSGSMTMKCTKTTEYKQPGKVDCSSGTCKPSTPPPEYNKTDETKDINKTTNPDGSTSTTTKTNTTNTSCKGLSACSSTSRLETDTEKTNADGDKTSSSGTCTGDNCKPGSSDSTGDKEEGEEEGDSSVSGETCDATVACTGDAIQCAILRQQKAQRCSDEEFRKVDDKAINDLRNTVAANQSEESFQPMQSTAENTFSLDGMIDTSSRFSKSCPVIPDFSFPSIDGETVRVPMTWVADWCQYLAWIGYMIIAFGMRRAAEIIAGGMN